MDRAVEGQHSRGTSGGEQARVGRFACGGGTDDAFFAA